MGFQIHVVTVKRVAKFEAGIARKSQLIYIFWNALSRANLVNNYGYLEAYLTL